MLKIFHIFFNLREGNKTPLTLCLNIKPNMTLYKTFCDSPAYWQTYLQEPASISMEGILLFNKHLFFLLTVIVLFVAWLLAYALHYFSEFNNRYDSKFVHSKELEIVWTTIPALILLILSTIIHFIIRYGLNI